MFAKSLSVILLSILSTCAEAQIMGSYPYPSFLAGTLAVGEQVTANFNAIKSAVNTNAAVLSTTNAAITAAQTTAITTAAPQGLVAFFRKSSCPTGWHALDGTGGYPDYRGYFVRSLNTSGSGWDQLRTLGSTQTDQMHDHQHGIGNNFGNTGQIPTLGGGGSTYIGVLSCAGGNCADTQTVKNGGNLGTENRPVNIALLACEKT